MNATRIINRLMLGNTHKDFTLPNYTPKEWWECDVIQVRPSGRWIEYEVKMTRGDFFADRKKEREVGPYIFGEKRPTALKHDLLQNTDQGPNFFYFVTPKDLLEPHEVPTWAGLIECWEAAGTIQKHYVTEAPLRHNKKVPDDVRQHALGVCYWRYHELRRAMEAKG